MITKAQFSVIGISAHLLHLNIRIGVVSEMQKVNSRNDKKIEVFQLITRSFLQDADIFITTKLLLLRV